MEIQEIISVIKALEKPKKSISLPFEIGKNYFIRTVTLYYTGKIVNILGQWIVLEEASWIADTGRFHDFLKDGKCNEYESFMNQVCVPLTSVIDITEWKHPLFKGQK